MAFPVIENTSTHGGTGNSSYTITLPAHNSGDVFLLISIGDYMNVSSITSGATAWTGETTHTNNDRRLYARSLIATGAETDVVVDYGASTAEVAITLYHFSNASGVIDSGGKRETAGTNTFIHVDSYIAPGGTQDSIWISYVGQVDVVSQSTTSIPTDFTGGISNAQDQAHLATAHRNYNGGDTLDPSGFGMSVGAPYISGQFVVYPGAGTPSAPVLSSPTSADLANTTATVGVSTDVTTGTLYWVVTTNSSTPTSAQIKAGNDAGGTAGVDAGSVAGPSSGANTFNAEGLTPNTGYYAFFIHEGSADSNIVGTTLFTTTNSSSITTAPLKNNTGTVLANEVDVAVYVYTPSTGVLVASTTTATTNASGVLVFSHASIVTATPYRVVIVLGNGDEGLTTVTSS